MRELELEETDEGSMPTEKQSGKDSTPRKKKKGEPNIFYTTVSDFPDRVPAVNPPAPVCLFVFSF